MQASNLQSTNKDFRSFFIREFVKELIIQKYETTSGSFEMLKASFEDPIKTETLEKTLGDLKKINLIQTDLPKPKEKLLKIPQPKIPQQFQHLMPSPGELKFSLGKLDRLIKDPNVKIIESRGPDTKIYVNVFGNMKETKISLNENEIDEIIKKFSETEKIPLSPGIIRIASGNLVLLAITSEIVRPKFMIKKILSNKKNRVNLLYNPYPRK